MEKIDKAIEILQAFKEGKTIEYRHLNSNNKWNVFDGKDVLLLNIITDYSFRIKSQPTYRPYTNTEEFIKASKEHGGWVLFNDGHIFQPISFDTEKMIIHFWCHRNSMYASDYSCSLDALVDCFKWADDNTPCGILEE